MKYILIFFILFTSCSKKEKIDPPISASSLKATLGAKNTIILAWVDNSTNETGYKIERKTTTNWDLIVTSGKDAGGYIDSNIILGTTYLYRVYPFNSSGNSLSYSNEVSISATFVPSLSKIDISRINYLSAYISGSIINNGGSNITSRGIVWGKNSNPTTSLTTKNVDSSSSNNLNLKVNGLNQNTTYYVRSFATNNIGTSYSDEISFITTTNPTTLNPVTIGDQIWMSKNLNVETFNDGTIIPEVKGVSEWANLKTPGWCYNNNDEKNDSLYGKLYNGYAILNSKNICPIGWHVPDVLEYEKLANFLGGGDIAGGYLKEKSNRYWSTPNVNYSKDYGFNAMPGGARIYSNTVPGCGFQNQNFMCNGLTTWLATKTSYTVNSSVTLIYIRDLYFEDGRFGTNSLPGNSGGSGSTDSKHGISVRCLKD